VFKGYIYITEGQTQEDYYESLGADVYKVDSYDGINLRKGPGTSYDKLVAIPDDTIILVTETKFADGYIWGRTSFDGHTGWCVLEYTELIYKQPEPTVPDASVTEPEETLPATSDEATADQATFDEIATDPTEPTEGETTAPEAQFVLGDTNGDGKISVTDATLIQKYLAKVGEILPDNLAKADISCDGRITVADATAIQKKLAGI